MYVVCFAAYSGMGKTSLIEKLIPVFQSTAQRVSVLKHAHHKFDVDKPGKDSWRFRVAGAGEVLLASDRRFALMHEIDRDNALDVHTLIARMDGSADWLLVEGFKGSDLPKVEVWRTSVGGEPLFVHDNRILAVATDDEQSLRTYAGHPDLVDLNEPLALYAWLQSNQAQFEYTI